MGIWRKMMSGIDSLKSSALGESSAKAWEKSIKDMNDIDETFANARDLGQMRLNYSRITAVGELANNDSVDIYKATVVSNRGKLSISMRNTNGDDQVLDLSKYEDFLNELKKQTDPEGYAQEQEEKLQAEADMKLLEATAPGMKIEVYYTDKFGRQQLVADSSADKESKEYETMKAMLTGEYMAQKGDYYIKVSRDEEIPASEDVSYALQLNMGEGFKHDYVAIESKSDDSKNKTSTKIPLTTSDGLSSVNALQIQATKYQATAQMLQVGYMNMANIYNYYNNKV